jgi:hypothetical protein
LFEKCCNIFLKNFPTLFYLKVMGKIVGNRKHHLDGFWWAGSSHPYPPFGRYI